MANHRPKILVADSDRLVARVFGEILEGEGYQADITDSGEVAASLVRDRSYDAVHIDLELQDRLGGEGAIHYIGGVQPGAPILVVSRCIDHKAGGIRDRFRRAFPDGELNVVGYIEKPLDIGIYLAAIDSAVRKRARSA